VDESKTYLEDEETSMANNIQKAFGWFFVTNRIVGNDFTKHEYVYQKKVTEVLNQLTFLIQHDRYQAEMQKKAFKG
jgi:hypothetical protein